MSVGVKEHRKHSAKVVMTAILTVSDSRTRRTDISGKVIRDEFQKAGHKVIRQGIVKDERREIRAWLKEAFKDARLHAIIINGGTGLARRDVTVETVRPLLEKEADGFGELFRMVSYKTIGSAAMMTRALAGIVNGKLVFCIPGSPDAAKLALKALILPEIGHMVWEAKR